MLTLTMPLSGIARTPQGTQKCNEEQITNESLVEMAGLSIRQPFLPDLHACIAQIPTDSTSRVHRLIVSCRLRDDSSPILVNALIRALPVEPRHEAYDQSSILQFNRVTAL
jgi:hypothetical protein